MSHVLSDTSCQTEWCLLHKKCDLKCQQFSACASWFTEDQERRKIYWASGNKVLDTFTMIQSVAYVNINMPSAISALKFESGSVPNDKNVTQNTRPSLYTYVKVWARDYSQTCYTVPGLCIQTVSSIFIWGTLARLLTVKLEEQLPSLSLPCSSLSQKPLCPQFPWLCSHLGYAVCVKLLHRKTSISLMLRHLSWFLSN